MFVCEKFVLVMSRSVLSLSRWERTVPMALDSMPEAVPADE